MKKILLILSAALIFSVYTGCKQDSDDSESTPQTFSKIEKLEYTGTGVDGNSKTLSALISYPAGTTISKAILYCHETQLCDEEIPSNNVDLVKAMNLVLGEYFIVLPDYEGYGSDSDSVHPYMNAEAAARQSVEALEAAMEYIGKKAKFSADFKTVIVGYSQGGQVALASQKYIENNLSGEKAAKINLKESFCGAGPYSLSTTMAEYLTDKTAQIPSPTILIYSIMGMIESYPEIFGETTTYDYLNNKLKNISSYVLGADTSSTEFGITDYISLGSTTLTNIDEIITEILAPETKIVTFNDLFGSTFEISNENPLYSKLIQAFNKNELTTGWIPKHKIHFFHATNDELVTVKNTENAYEAFTTAGCSEDIIPEPTYLPISNLKDGESVHSAFASRVFLTDVVLLLKY